MKSRIWNLKFGICMVLIATGAANAQAPTLDEALAWLKTQLSTRASYSITVGSTSFTHTFEPIEFTNCNLKWRMTAQMSFARSSSASEITVNAGALEPGKTTISRNSSARPWTLELFSRAGFRTQSIEKLGAAETRGEIEHPTRLKLLFGEEDDDLVPRISKAFARAAELCKDKKDPF